MIAPDNSKALQESTILQQAMPNEPSMPTAGESLLEDSRAWARTIYTSCTELFGKMIIGKGLAGELYARLIPTLARDALNPRPGLAFTVNEFLTQLYEQKEIPLRDCEN